MKVVTLTENTKLPIKLVAALVGLLAGLAGTAAVAQYRISEHDAKIDTLSASERDSDRRLQRVEDNLEHIREALRRIERRMDRGQQP